MLFKYSQDNTAEVHAAAIRCLSRLKLFVYSSTYVVKEEDNGRLNVFISEDKN